MKNGVKNIAQLFLLAADQYPDRIAIIAKSDEISYSDLAQEVRQTASYFKKKGIKRGDRVLVFVPMGIDLYRIVLALFYIGATAVFLDEWVNKKRLELCCSLADCKGFIGVFKARVFALFSKELRKIPIKLKLKKKDSEIIDLTEVDGQESALITFTTGSTGVPKAADRSHAFLQEQFEVLIEKIDPHFSDIDMPALPIVLFINLGLGCTSVVADFKITKPNSLNPQVILEQIKKHQVNRITASPFFLKKLAEYVINSKLDTSQIEKTFTGGAPVFPAEAQLYLQGFPKAKSTIVYGSTEAEPISSIECKELVDNKREIEKGLLVGKPYHKTELKIIKIIKNDIANCTQIELKEYELKDGGIGEIIVAGDHVLKRYFNNETAFQSNKIVVEDTIWHRTGDSGFLKNGNLYLTGRSQQLITKDGKYISPFIIEQQLKTIPGIKEGTLVQVGNKLIVVIESNGSAEEFRRKIDFFKFDKIKVVQKIPMDPRHNSKIDYGKLVEIITLV